MTQSSGSSGIQQQAMSTASQSMPWRKDVAWWVILIQAIILTLLGAYVLLAPESAGRFVILAAGIMLLIDGVMAAVGSMRGRHAGRANTLNAINAGIAIIVGLLVIIGFLDPGFLPGPTAALLAALGLVATGAISLILALFMRPPGEKIRWLRVLGPVVWIAFGVLVLLTRGGTVDTLRIIGVAALAIGILLFVLTYFRFKASKAEAATQSAAPAAAPTAAAPKPATPAPAPAPAAAAPPAPKPAEPAPVPKAAEPPPAAPPAPEPVKPTPEAPAASEPPSSEPPAASS